ncbi:unnamed protein product [Caenorhabditis angaria]|uniref:Uncharacterized protein n=1 Tax=Caenorhabditis angaria TaxID=860376 RepID=A0A9P1I9G1_9PELO|nr:unnamed protein product [Caenorhabditis angaria]
MLIIISILISTISCAPALPALNILSDPQGPLLTEYINAITAYGPGLGVYTPYSYVDVSYDNIPFIGKVPLIGKDGTSSRLGVSPFYPPGGNPSNPWPPLYKARPLPMHVPEPQDVVAVPLDEEALHGEPLFPPELTLPSEQAAIEEAAKKELLKETDKPNDPFSGTNLDLANENEEETHGEFVNWPAISESVSEGVESDEKNTIIESSSQKHEIIVDEAREKAMKPNEVSKIAIGANDRPKSPFRSRRILMERY